MKDPERGPRAKAVITLTVEQDADGTDKDAYIINAETDGLKGGEESLLAVLDAYVAHLKEQQANKKNEQSS